MAKNPFVILHYFCSFAFFIEKERQLQSYLYDFLIQKKRLQLTTTMHHYYYFCGLYVEKNLLFPSLFSYISNTTNATFIWYKNGNRERRVHASLSSQIFFSNLITPRNCKVNIGSEGVDKHTPTGLLERPHCHLHHRQIIQRYTLLDYTQTLLKIKWRSGVCGETSSVWRVVVCILKKNYSFHKASMLTDSSWKSADSWRVQIFGVKCIFALTVMIVVGVLLPHSHCFYILPLQHYSKSSGQW